MGVLIYLPHLPRISKNHGNRAPARETAESIGLSEEFRARREAHQPPIFLAFSGALAELCRISAPGVPAQMTVKGQQLLTRECD